MKSNNSFIKIFGLTNVIIGSIIGAGFASGKEIATFFGNSFFTGILYALLTGIFFSFFIYKCLIVGQVYNGNITFFYKKQFGKFGSFINVVIVFSSLIFLSAMIAGSKSLGRFFVNENYSVIFPAITAILAFCVLKGGFKSTVKVNSYTIPIVLIFILFISIFSIFNGEIEFMSNNIIFDFILGFVNCINYVCMNMLLLGVFLIQIGNKFTKQQIKLSSVISSLIIAIFLILIIVAVFSLKFISNSDMPLVSISFHANYWLGIISTIIVWLGLFTSILSCGYIIINSFSTINIPKILVLICMLVVCYLFSFLGFAFIVVNFYSVVGVLGFLFFSIALRA